MAEAEHANGDGGGTSSAVPAQTGVTAQVNPGGGQFIELYTPDGKPVYVPAEMARDLSIQLGLIETRWDLDTCFNELHAAIMALEDVIVRGHQEILALGYQREESVWVMNEAAGKFRNAYAAYSMALGANIPGEAHIAAIATHKQQYGDLYALPNQRRFEPVADRMAQDVVAAHQERAGADRARQAQEQAALPEEEKRLRALAREFQLKRIPVEYDAESGRLVRPHPATGRHAPVDETTGDLLGPATAGTPPAVNPASPGTTGPAVTAEPPAEPEREE